MARKKKRKDEPLSAEHVLADFMRLVEATVRPEDEGTHRDLAATYEKMGLLEEALHEYRVALACRNARTK